jgi:ABC-type multidrug transport system ATPase subunit
MALEIEIKCPKCGTGWALSEEETQRTVFVCGDCQTAFDPQQAVTGQHLINLDHGDERFAPRPPEMPAVIENEPAAPVTVASVEAGAALQPLDAAALVRIEDVTKTFGEKVALRGISFSVPPGQICGLLGPNGAGKTTLFRLLMGILKATEGVMLVDGLDVFEDRVETKRLIGFLPDEPVFYSYLSGREVLELSAAMHGLEPVATMNRMQPLIAQLRLSEDIGKYAEDYSRGMKKKLGLLLAMLHDPKLLILDEPTNGLDVESTHLFYDLILSQAREGKTVLFSTHLMDHVAKLCSHAVIINEGTTVARGSLEELRAAFGEASLEDIFLRLTARPAQT